MALDSDNLTGLYIAIAIYFGLLALAAMWAYQRLKKARQKKEASGEKEDEIEAHYLGNRSFGTLMTAGSIFASFFSGYTVVGVPNEAYYHGWYALRWAVATLGIVTGFLASSARLRKIGILRNHQSPVDFITDRFQSQVLRFTIVAILLFSSLIYLTAQLVSIRSTFNSLFKIDPESPVAVVTIASIILIFEWMGGLSSVAMTDLIQGFIMVTVFFVMPIVIHRNYGGWDDLDWETYPNQELYQTPTGNEQWLFWNFVVILSGGFVQPHLIQRVYAAESFGAIKVACAILAVGPWLTMITGVFLGTMGVQILSDLGQAENVSSPYASMLEAVMDLGGFGYFVGVVASTATLAAIMSTADSVIIAISQLLTSEVVTPLFPELQGNQVAWVGRSTSLCSMAIAVLLTLYTGQGISELTVIQFSLAMMALPTFVIGMYGYSNRDCHPWSLALAAIVGLVAVFWYNFGVIRDFGKNEEPLHAGLFGLFVNLAALVVFEVLGRATASGSSARPLWDRPELLLSKFAAGGCGGEEKSLLTGDFVWSAMKTVREPVTEAWFGLLILALSILCSPITETATPPLGEDGQLLWAPNVVGGIPAWAFKILMALMISTFVLLYAINLLPNSLFPEDEEETKDLLLLKSLVEKEEEHIEPEETQITDVLESSNSGTPSDEVTEEEEMGMVEIDA